MNEKVISDIGEKLREKECKFTSRREHILKVLLENKGNHLCAEDIYNLVKQKAPDVGIATVYRTLELFQEFDIINSMDFGDGRRRYEFGGVEGVNHHHHHLICTKCGAIIEVNEDLLEELENRVSKQYDFNVTNHQLKIFGICKKCI
ncbi:transcriptional repressor [Pelotomaculum terephthalicicum JT]|uniref:Fur family transcriptional regulator n=1 Tax=Pelotomaculum TaxID=191373 RepID=UPI0009C5A299|nr:MULTISPECIES: transcriptional repressor [Pelotomaculum]MCG9968090.1 transcriptional repressor [Pelotomaculum terephthalicicum JT]OPX85611.1 MAG: Ferric uptake regulation protein [Pelotomaculum sp. PtaB.Bin117]OPY64017.1 MAG: Ferric uptake regulation protein [Pelotomaculum sp. PtaU1.Bin065]